jgi:hypothetical protein
MEYLLSSQGRSSGGPGREGVRLEPVAAGALNGFGRLSGVLAPYRPALTGLHEIPHRGHGGATAAVVRRLSLIRDEMKVTAAIGDPMLFVLVG